MSELQILGLLHIGAGEAPRVATALSGRLMWRMRADGAIGMRDDARVQESAEHLIALHAAKRQAIDSSYLFGAAAAGLEGESQP